MTYSEVVKAARKKILSLDTGHIHEHIAVEFDIEGEGEGAFYAEFNNGEAHVEPYDYHDNDFRVRGDSDSILMLLDGGINSRKASGLIRIEGNIDRAAALQRLLEGKKLTTQKTEPQKLTTSKTEAQKISTSKKEHQKITTSKTERQKITTSKKENQKITTSKKESQKIETQADSRKRLTTSKA